MITAAELRSKYLDFFQAHGHALLPSASLLPENDPTVLFTTAGMHPLVPYLLGERHPAGTRLCSVQCCIRTGDIEEVGDSSHCTFFEMLGNWSLGDYFKDEAIAMSWEFLTSDKYLGLDPDRLAFSVFAGDEDAPRDDESAKLWMSHGVKPERIFYLPKENNWWGPAGQTGPCGPDTEMFIITDKAPCGPDCSPACSCGRYLEIWNDVFMQYNKQGDGSFAPLAKPNVDTGMGLERTIGVLQGVKSVYETDLFAPIMACIEKLAGQTGDDEATVRAKRIVADHLRTATFILGDPRGVTPGNVDAGYVLRRLIRRAIRFGQGLGLPADFPMTIAGVVVDNYGNVYPSLAQKRDLILSELATETTRFEKTLRGGLKEFDKATKSMTTGDTLDGVTAFHLYDTFGFPVEMTVELAAERGLTVDMPGYETAFKAHQALSQAGAEQRFKGGLADDTAATARLHTATHLMLAALRLQHGPEVFQRGSNITAERLRFDFSFPRKLMPEEVAAVQAQVREWIAADLPITCTEMSLDDARNAGAMGIFDDRYEQSVKVYAIGDVSKEICGGPHAERTGELGTFTIQKEESSSSGVRRLKAILA